MPAQSYSNLLPKEPGFAPNAPSQAAGQEQRATAARRRKSQARTLGPGEDIFRNYSWSPPQDTGDGPGPKTPGRRPYEWTPRKSRELITLIIHTDLKFDDIATAMKDENGQGPCEFTCRNHWHDIFGYRPDLARLKNREGREQRFDEHVKKFEAYKKHSGAKPPSELTDEGGVDTSPTNDSESASRDSSVRNNSFTPSDESPYGESSYLDEPGFYEMSGYASSSMHPGNGGLAPVTEEDDSENIAPDDKVPVKSIDNSRGVARSRAQDRKVSKAGEKSAAQIEDKEGLPTGFLTAFKRLSFASSFASSLYGGSRNSSRTSFAIPTGAAPPPTGLFSYVSQKAVPKNAICSYLDNCSAVTQVPTDHIEELIERGADINGCNRKGETPLHLAVKLGNIVVFSYLVTRGADVNAKTRAGESIWKYGGKASKAILPPDKVYENKGRQLLDTMVCAHIEFLRATARYNPELVTDESGAKGKKRRASDDSIDFNKIGQRYRRSGAVGVQEKRSRLQDGLATFHEEDEDFFSRLEQVVNSALDTQQDVQPGLAGGFPASWNNDPVNLDGFFNGTQQQSGSNEGLDPNVAGQMQNITYDATTLTGQNSSYDIDLSYQSQDFNGLDWPQQLPEQTGSNSSQTPAIPDNFHWDAPKPEHHNPYSSANVAIALPDSAPINAEYTSTTPGADFTSAWPNTNQTAHYDMSALNSSEFQRQAAPHPQLFHQTHASSNLYQQLQQQSTNTQYLQQDMPHATVRAAQQSRQEDEIAKVEMELQAANARSRSLMDKLSFLRARASLRRNGPPQQPQSGSSLNPLSWASGSSS